MGGPPRERELSRRDAGAGGIGRAAGDSSVVVLSGAGRRLFPYFSASALQRTRTMFEQALPDGRSVHTFREMAMLR